MRYKSRRVEASYIALSTALGAILLGYCLSGGAAKAQSLCAPILGINILCQGGPAADPTLQVLNLAPIVGPVSVDLGDGFQLASGAQLITQGTGADVTLNALGTATIDTVNQVGLLVNSGGRIDGSLTQIVTSGDGAAGALLTAVDDVIFTVDDAVSTIGDNAPGLDIEGATISLTTGDILTDGNNSNGVQLVSLTGPITLTGDLIDTGGNLSTAAVVRSAGNVNLNLGVLRTAGSQALGLDISTAPATCVLLGTGGCDVTAAVDQITTNGFGGIGALLSAATGVTTIQADVLQTGGDEAAGLDLSTDPTVCAALGTGACDQNFTVGNLLTGGARSPGALVRAAGNIAADVGILRTDGEDAIGLDLASAPDACVLLGAGNCGTAFNVGQLTTSGAGATGVLARIVGPTTGRIGLLETTGDNATGIDIAGDPDACVLLGTGACDVDLTSGPIKTAGDGALGVLINVPANVLANIAGITTGGNNATGLGVVLDPTLCLVLGNGACSVDVSTGPVDTGGNNSPGVDVDNGGDGPTTVDTGPVHTGGDNSPGVDVDGGTGPTTVTTGPVTTDGDNSPGVDVSSEGPITVGTGPVTTGGNTSPGVIIDGGAGPVSVDTTPGPIKTTGSDSNGVDVTTDSGNQTIVTGPVIVTGPGSDGIVATSPGCSQIAITATGPVSSAQGTGIVASSACGVSVTTTQGAPISGQSVGMDITSGTGSTITIGDEVSATGGPAINTNGGGSTLVIADTGHVTGTIDLTDGNDTITNNGQFTATADSQFGSGIDLFNNRGTLTVRPGATTAGSVTFTGLETFQNSGLIDLRNGVAGDSLTLPGNFTGLPGSQLALDIGATTTDRLVAGGAATGHTDILLAETGNTGLLTDTAVLVDAGAGSAPDAFTLAPNGSTIGLVSYGLQYDPATNDYLLSNAPSTQGYALVKVNDGARETAYRAADAWTAHMQAYRDAARPGETTADRDQALWLQVYGSKNTMKAQQAFMVGTQNQTVTLDNRQNITGAQMGYDFAGRNGMMLGLTAGFANSVTAFDHTIDQFKYDIANVGAYAGYARDRFYANALIHYDRQRIRVTLPSAGIDQRLNGSAYGGKLEAGLRFGGDTVFVEPNVSVEYVRSDIDNLTAGPSTVDFDTATGTHGQAGLRFVKEIQSANTRTRLYANVGAVHEFDGKDGARLTNNGRTVVLPNERPDDYGRVVIGATVADNSRINGFVEVSRDFGGNYEGGGLRGGFSIRF